MNVLSIAKVSARALLRNKTRSFLTALGIVIGVGAVIAMVSIGEGAKRRVEETFEAMGTNMLIVVPGSSSGATGGMRGGAGSQATLTWSDLDAIRKEAPAVALAAPALSASVVAQVEDQNWTTRLTGTSPDYLTIRNWKVAQGRLFDASDVESGSKVVLLGQTVIDHLWSPGYDPVGQTIRIRSTPFIIIGALEKKGQSPVGRQPLPLAVHRAP